MLSERSETKYGDAARNTRQRPARHIPSQGRHAVYSNASIKSAIFIPKICKIHSENLQSQLVWGA